MKWSKAIVFLNFLSKPFCDFQSKIACFCIHFYAKLQQKVWKNRQILNKSWFPTLLENQTILLDKPPVSSLFHSNVRLMAEYGLSRILRPLNTPCNSHQRCSPAVVRFVSATSRMAHLYAELRNVMSHDTIKCMQLSLTLVSYIRDVLWLIINY